MAKSSDSAGVRFPPPLVFIGLLLIGLALDPLVGSFGLVWTLRWAAGVIVAVGGLVIIGMAIGLFRRAGTRPEPWVETSAIVADGVYAATRNPMYLGMAAAQAGLAILFDSLAGVLLVPVAMALIHAFVIAREEAYLTAKFGDAYLAYKAAVPRWF